MINLLPPQVKAEIAYARRNTVIRRYLITLGLVGAAAALGLGGASWYIANQLSATQATLADKQTAITAASSVEKQAKSLSDRLKIIKTITATQSHFSIELADFAKVMPQGVALVGLQLTGDDKKPLQVSAMAPSYAAAVSTRDALATSVRVAAVDIQSITNSGGQYRVDLVVSFKPGAAR